MINLFDLIILMRDNEISARVIASACNTLKIVLKRSSLLWTYTLLAVSWHIYKSENLIFSEDHQLVTLSLSGVRSVYNRHAWQFTNFKHNLWKLLLPRATTRFTTLAAATWSSRFLSRIILENIRSYLFFNWR